MAFIGRARLSSFKEQGDLRQGGGFFGISEPQDQPQQTLSVRDPKLIPPCFPPPETQGTSIYIPVALTDAKLNRLLKESVQAVIGNFWPAIHRGNLQVVFEGFGDSLLKIDADTLPDVIREYEDPNYPITPFYQAFQQKPTVRTFDGLGEVKLYMLLGEKLPKKTVWMRSPLMVVKKKGTNTPVPFAAVLLCDSKEGNALLRLMEPPEHNDWLVDRAPHDRRPAARKALSDIRTFVRDAVREAGTLDPGELHDIPALQDLLPGAEEHTMRMKSSGKDTTKQQTDKETGQQRNALTPQTPAKVTTSRKFTHDVQLVTKTGRDRLATPKPPAPNGNRKGNSSGTGSDSKSKPDNQKFEITAGRIWAVRQGNRNAYRISLQGTPGLTGAIQLKLQSEAAELKPSIQSVTDQDGHVLKAEGSIIRDIHLTGHGTQLLTVMLHEPGRYCLTFSQEVTA
ncbi:hypothetical protein DM785_16490 (plasmid) [Deinococcus actinosclerus]|nr:hypothetical protein DM785_16490 [Deinococcus actinosclerus]